MLISLITMHPASLGRSVKCLPAFIILGFSCQNVEKSRDGVELYLFWSLIWSYLGWTGWIFLKSFWPFHGPNFLSFFNLRCFLHKLILQIKNFSCWVLVIRWIKTLKNSILIDFGWWRALNLTEFFQKFAELFSVIVWKTWRSSGGISHRKSFKMSTRK